MNQCGSHPIIFLKSKNEQDIALSPVPSKILLLHMVSNRTRQNDHYFPADSSKHSELPVLYLTDW